jgi:2,3-bisphosphoglycerate-dependent phosphoglycerate mutase
MRMPPLVLVRHGQSLWNSENRFTGSVDVPLTDLGRGQARDCARDLTRLRFDVAYTSKLWRAQETLEIILDTLGQQPPVIRDAALDERHYGNLQGLDKEETARRFGAAQVQAWRRSFDITPPGGESLEDVVRRTWPFFERSVLGDLVRGKCVLVVAHGNSIRAIVSKLENLDREGIPALELALGVPRVYEFGSDGRAVRCPA